MSENINRQGLDEFSKDERTNLTMEQSRLWFLKKLDPNYPDNHLVQFELVGEVNTAILQICLSDTLNCFAALRSNFMMIAGKPLKKESLCSSLKLKMIDVCEDRTIYDRVLKDELYYSFDYEKESLIRFILIKCDIKKHILLVNASSFILDKSSITLIVRNLLLNYAEYVQGNDEYKNYLINTEQTPLKIEKKWLKDTLQTNDAVDFWRNKLEQCESLEFLPDFIRPEVRNHCHDSIKLTLSGKKLEKILVFFNKNKYELNSALFCLYTILLVRYLQKTDILIGTKQDLREFYKDNGLIGSLTNTVVKRVCIESDHTFHSLFNLVEGCNQEVANYAKIPFAYLLQELSIKRDLNRTPLFQIAYEYEDMSSLLTENPLIVKKIPNSFGKADVDIAMSVARMEQELTLRVDFNTSIYLKETIQIFLNSFETLLDSLIEEPKKSVFYLTILDKEERAKIINNSLQSIVGACHEDKFIHTLFEEQVDKTPGLPAIKCQDQVLTYQELDEYSNNLAHFLCENNYDCKPIGIYLDRSTYCVVAMLGILKAGGAYVPIDPEYPKERINYMLHDSQISCVVTQSSLLRDLKGIAAHKIILDKNWSDIRRFSKNRLNRKCSSNDLAYVIYTSGSTGKPKAVLLRHKGVVNDIYWRQNTWKLTSQDRVLQNSSFSFDPSVWATFWPISVGACSIITPPNYQNDANLILELMCKEDISLIGTVPSMISMLMTNPEIHSCKSLKYVLSGGERLSIDLLKKIMEKPGIRVTNIYGPTEATINATSYECNQHNNNREIPIGKPIRNQSVYILDELQQPVPTGAVGEIYIGGIGTALGYHNRFELTNEKFLLDPFINIPDGKMYRTGDLGRFLIDGNIEFLGRIDNQVKLHGFRIELSEIEGNILAHPDIIEAMVFLKENNAADHILIAYVVTKGEKEITREEINAFLSINLPKYMLLNAIFCLPQFPKTVNGKIDLDALPVFSGTKARQTQQLESNIEVSPIQKVVTDAFELVLNIENINDTDDFFELGGTSLMLTRLVTHLFNYYNLSIPLHQFFKVPTIAGVSEMILIYQKEGLDSILLNQHAISLETDAVLDEDIELGNLTYFPNNDPNCVLLTGATGYLGAFLLQQVLSRTKANVYCLVRANTREQAKTRIKKIMFRYGAWDESYSKRILPMNGDLSKKRLGLSNDDWSMLANKVEIIYHNGALVNFAYPYSALRGSNVLGTKELLRLACDKRIKAFHYVSTIDVLLAAHCPRPFIENDEPIKTFSNIPGGYTGSKWVAEKLVYTALQRGLPVSIYRPGLIMGHTESGATQENDYLLVAFRGFLPMGIMPEYKRIFDVVPVDYVAKSIVSISLHEGNYGKFYHLFNPAPVSLHQFLEWTRTYGYKFKIVPFDVARERAITVAANNPLYPLIPLIRDADPEPHITLDPRYIDTLQPALECKNSLTILRQHGITCPGMSENLTHLCLNFLVNTGFFPEPHRVHSIKDKIWKKINHFIRATCE